MRIKKIRDSWNSEKGYVMMLSLVIMMTLTVIGIGYVTNVSLQSNIIANRNQNHESLNCAEAGLEVAMMITHEEITSSLEPYDGTKRLEVQSDDPNYDDNITKYYYHFQTLFKDCNGTEVKYRVIPENPDPQKNRFVYRTYVSCSELIHYAYPYVIEVIAKPSSGGGVEYLKRQIRVLETPLVQYFIFFDDDLPWHPGPTMNAWGRIHTNGNLWFAGPTGGIWIKNFTDDNEKVQHFVTASGVIYAHSVLGPNPPWIRDWGHNYVRVYDLDDPTIVTADYVELDVNINAANAETQQDRFTDPATDCTYVMVGVPKSPTLSFNALFRGGFYEKRATTPDRSEYFGIAIVLEYPAMGNWPPEAIADLTGELHIYAATKDFAYDSYLYTDGVKIEDVTEQVFNAGDIGESGGDPLDSGHALDGSIVISPETVYNNGSLGLPTFPATDTTSDFPVYFERNDQRQDMAGVALTVINLKKLENWFFEYYLDEQYDGDQDDQPIDDFLYDMITGNPTKLVVYVSRTPTVDEITGIAGWDGVYTTEDGPPFPYYDDPSNQILQGIKLWKSTDLICATTVVTDNPIYVEGDFNTPTRKGCAIIGDLVNLLSAEWHSDHSGHIPGGKPPGDNTVINNDAHTSTEYCAAFFSGRDDIANFSIRGGTHNDETEGIHNFLEFHEDWHTSCHIVGCIINLWFTRQALGLFDCCGGGPLDVYNPPTRHFGWDPGYMDPSYWPPYCPSAYGVERVGWLEGDEYDEVYLQDPTE